MEDKILDLLGRPGYTPLNAAELTAELGLARNRQRDMERALASLERTGRVARLKQGQRYGLPLDADLIPGRIRMNRQGNGWLQPDDARLATLHIPHDATGTALHGDRVLVRKDSVPRFRGRSARDEGSGRVVRILERAHTQLVGTLQRGRQFLYVIPDDPRFSQDIYVSEPRDVGRPANIGDKVVVELREWTSRHTNPEGEIIEVLGSPDAEGVDMLSVIRQYQLPLHFPKRVLQDARAFGQEIKESEVAGRVDCRQHQVVTIDPPDAKDFDDAICVVPAPDNHWKLWVHIADVSHYVKPGTALDEEASKRGNSTYLVDRVIPMLPEALSNELCSLKPRVDRLTKCVEFLLTGEGRVVKSRFYPAVIRSQCRYSYKEVFGILQREPLDSLERMLHEAHRLAQKVRQARMRAGSLDLDFPESKIILDDRGKVLRIEKVENDFSHQLIEEFMLLANEAVAERLTHQHTPAVYRVHEAPDEKRLQEYREELLSHHIQCGNLSNRREVQKLLEKLNGLPIGAALKIGFLKSLMRARYAIEPLGHYGLAKKHYTHFTSPIRRYADLVVHRSLFEPRGTAVVKGGLAAVADHISETERNSDDAERDSKDVKMFAYLLAQLETDQPQTYPALITDVRNFGFFVDVPGLGMSGLVPVSGLSDDFYQFDAARGQLVGRRTRRVFKLGNRLDVQVAKVDTFKRQVDFRLAGAERARLPEAGRATKGHAPAHRQRGKAGRQEPHHPQAGRGGSAGKANPRSQGRRFHPDRQEQKPAGHAQGRESHHRRRRGGRRR